MGTITSELLKEVGLVAFYTEQLWFLLVISGDGHLRFPRDREMFG